MRLGVGIVASIPADCSDRKDLQVIDAEGLFPRSTTWIGFRKDAVLRRYMADFIKLFAPHVTDRELERAIEARNPAGVDEIFADAELPLRSGCADGVNAAASDRPVGWTLVDNDVAIIDANANRAREALRSTFGFDGFRGRQEDVVERLPRPHPLDLGRIVIQHRQPHDAKTQCGCLPIQAAKSPVTHNAPFVLCCSGALLFM